MRRHSSEGITSDRRRIRDSDRLSASHCKDEFFSQYIGIGTDYLLVRHNVRPVKIDYLIIVTQAIAKFNTIRKLS